MSENEERVLGWDDEISNDDQGGFEVVPPGTYPFEIVNLRRGQHQPSSSGKLPACPKAELTVRLYPQNGDYADVKHNLFLHSRCEGMLCAFFLSIGHRKHGEPLRPDWARVIGSRGWCKVAIRDWTSKDGEKRQSNDIKAFLDPEKALKNQSPAPPANNPIPFDDQREDGF